MTKNVSEWGKRNHMRRKRKKMNAKTKPKGNMHEFRCLWKSCVVLTGKTYNKYHHIIYIYLLKYMWYNLYSNILMFYTKSVVLVGGLSCS